MSCAALRNSLLEARDRRQDLLDGLFPAPLPATIMLSLNLPGDEKTGLRAEKLFAWGRQSLIEFIPVLLLHRGADALGPFALYRCHLEPKGIKRLAMSLETRHPAGRLLDLDVFDFCGRPVDRGSLGHPPRPCLLCHEPALACIHAQRHDMHALKRQAHAVIDAL